MQMTVLMQYTYVEYMMSLSHTLQIGWVQNQEHQEDHRDQNARPEEDPYLHMIYTT